ncbi:DUF300-domain-containing protein [Sistotremastrum suecicum HHB10207 ss-3]|uniref:DUF300-domain-containing protein n=1 Tax=Sistotremastrum suecicum HHB10207 ss-3 TaxID=1314776 RepID=A0A165XKH9_9AGAM|nr:DUF300-domain-containing protein [Sistotremastrum suecicum HHB10207 ss-3]
MPAICADDNTQAVEQDDFWSTLEHGGHLQAHQIGWLIAGACTVVAVVIALINIFRHARNYLVPAEQRQILRILYMPPIFGIISFFSYRYFREYVYYELIQIIYEAITIAAFFLLIVEFVAATASDNRAEMALMRKDKKALPLPFCCFRFRPTKPYFMYTIKWAVLQYVIVRPLVSLAGIITNAEGLYCESGGYNIHFAYAYLEGVDFISISITLYGLIVFYALTREELKGRRPLAKFIAIKLIIFFTFYQSFVFSVLEKTGKIKATTYWTQTNVANGLNALCICIEMVFFSAFMLWAYPASDYVDKTKGHTSIWRPLLDSVNFSDFAIEIWRSTKFFIDYWRKKPYTRSTSASPSGTTYTKETVGGYNKESTEISRGDENDTRPFAARPPLKNDFDSAFGLRPERYGRTTAGAFARGAGVGGGGGMNGGNMAGVGAGVGGRRGDYDDVPLVANANGRGHGGGGSIDSMSGEDVEMRPVGGVNGGRRMR